MSRIRNSKKSDKPMGSLLLAVLALAVLCRCSEQRSMSVPAPTGDALSKSNLIETDPIVAGSFAGVYKETFSAACVECHNPSGMATVNYNVQLNFASKEAAYTSLMSSSVNGVTSSAACGQVMIVVPGSPNQSYLIGTLISSYSSGSFAGVAGCTPYAGHYSIISLSQSQQDNMIKWISNGAREVSDQ